MENHLSNQLKSIYGNKTLYEIFDITSNSTQDEIKRAYRKLALKNHPDKGGNEETFKAISVVYSILSDDEKRKCYDETGSIDENDGNTDQNFDFWYSYFRNLFPKISVDKIDSFSKTYKSSSEEHTDIILEYTKHQGDMEKIMSCVMLAEDEDIERISLIIDEAIENGEIELFPKYDKSKKSLLNKIAKENKRNTSNKKRRSDSKNNINDAADLIAAIATNAAARGMANIFTKYGGNATESLEDIPDDEFEKLREKVVKRSKQNEKIKNDSTNKKLNGKKSSKK
eukprot:gene5321-7386_t